MSLSDHLHRWKALWAPERYHGWGRTRAYFEGWYFKLVHPNGEAALAIIPGVALNRESGSEAFIQVLDGITAKAAYHRFPIEAFEASPDTFAVRIGKNHFSRQGLQLDLPGLSGELQFADTYPWPATLGAPGIMGWYAFMPFMECYHGVWSMHHALDGRLDVNGRLLDFKGGKGYGEKDWGTSFPRGWIWAQCQHFDTDERVSAMISIAHIPWMRTEFVGYIGGVLVGDRLFRFATYLGTQRRTRIEGKSIHIELRNKRQQLTLRAHPGPGGVLQSPIRGEMTGKVNESLLAEMEIHLQEDGHTIFEGHGKFSGLEAAGDVDGLLADEWVK